MDWPKWIADILATGTANAIIILMTWLALHFAGYQVRISIEPRRQS